MTTLEQVKIKLDLVGMEHFPNDDTDKLFHNVYKVTVGLNGKQTSFNFWDSAHNTNMGIEPTKESILDTIVSDYNYTDYAQFDDFCADMGYDTDSRKAEKIWKNCLKQSKKLQKVFSQDDIRELQEQLEATN